MTRHCSVCGAEQHVASYTDDCLYCAGPLAVWQLPTPTDLHDLNQMDFEDLLVPLLKTFWALQDLMREHP